VRSRVKISGRSGDRFLALIISEVRMVEAQLHVPGEGDGPLFTDLGGDDLRQFCFLIVHNVKSGSG
jgi:hypothetical protein